jgi:hypothetical protein
MHAAKAAGPDQRVTTLTSCCGFAPRGTALSVEPPSSNFSAEQLQPRGARTRKELSILRSPSYQASLDASSVVKPSGAGAEAGRLLGSFHLNPLMDVCASDVLQPITGICGAVPP